MSGSNVNRRPRLLIVEDERIVAADLEAILDSLGYDVLGSVESARKAIREAEQSRPDLVLMDIQLEGSMDGIAAAEEIRHRHSIPIVFLTANANEETLARAKATAPYGYVVKPFRANDLNATIRVALNQHHLAKHLFAEHTWLVTTLGSLSDGVIATDEQGRVRYMNSAAEQFTGRSLAKSTGEPIEEVYPLCNIYNEPLTECQVRKALAAATPIGKERFLLTYRDGRKIPVEDSAAPIIREGRVAGAVTVFTDITDRLRREREQEIERDRLEEEVHVATEALGQTRSELRALSGHLMAAQEEERRRIGRELHDDFGQRTAVLGWQLEQLSQMAPFEGQSKNLVEVIRSEMTKLAKGISDTSHRLYPSVLNDVGLVAGIRELVESFQEGGLDVSFENDRAQVELPLDISTALYRITQEALRNLTKHCAGAAARITLSETDDALLLTIEDSGPGFDLASTRAAGGLGLISMQERARVAGGTMRLRTAPGKGTEIAVEIPLRLGRNEETLSELAG